MEYIAHDLEISEASQLRVRAGHQQCQWVLSNTQGRVMRMITLPNAQFPDWLADIEDVRSLEVKVYAPIFGQTWIPLPLYDETHLPAYGAFVEGPEQAPLQVVNLEPLHAKSVFRADRYPYRFLKEKFPQLQEEVVLHALLNGLVPQSPKQQWYLDFFDDQMLVLCFGEKGFVQHTCVACSTKEDVAYHLLMLSQELKVENTEIEGVLSGIWPLETESMLQNFFQKTQIMAAEQYADIFLADPFDALHQYAALFVPGAYAHHSR
jgi:hypothetical protein